MRLHYFFLVLVLSILSNCREDAGLIADLRSRYAPEKQQIIVPVNRDTTIVCKNGTRLHFCKNSFLTSAPTVTLEVREVLSRAEMVALGLNTRTTDGRTLESAGMFHIQPIKPASVRINPDCPIRVAFPANSIVDKTLLFSGKETNGLIQWENPAPFNNDSLISAIATGRQLFCRYCAACHNRQLDQYLTGPPLAHIQLYREMPWLVEFTINSRRMIAAGDPQALEIWNQFKPAAMDTYEFLSDREIQAIFIWIAEESTRQGIPVSGPEASTDSLSAHSAVQRSLTNIRYFLFPQTEFEWRNIDVFLDQAPEVRLAVQIKNNQEYDELAVILVYENRNLVLDLFPNKAGQFVPSNKPKINLPLDPVLIKCFGVKGRQLYTGELRVMLKAENQLIMKLQPEKPELIDAYFQSISKPLAPRGNGCELPPIETSAG